jgi:short subunit dehydrogenase-like uncharacterized protein
VSDRPLHVVVFGATGFVGRLVAAYLVRARPDGVRIGLAGRSEERLAALREGLGEGAADWPLIRADLSEPASLAELARSTRVVATTAGPYAPRGLPLVEACVAARTHYADLAGEVLFIRESIDRCHAEAEANGTRIVHACDVDSIPSDLGTLLVSEEARADGGGDLEETIALVTAFRGGFSGGTLATMRGQLEEVRVDPTRRATVDDPYSLSPDRGAEPELGEQGELRSIERDRDSGTWLAPFVMASMNTRVVRRSNALQGWAYGRRFRYVEAMAFEGVIGGALKAAATAAGLALLRFALTSKLLRPLSDRVLPAPGEGPNERARLRGRFEMQVRARAADGSTYVAHIAADADPGYGASSLMLGESALCLALDEDRLPPRGGVLTPTTAMGRRLAERLSPGVTFDVAKAA